LSALSDGWIPERLDAETQASLLSSLEALLEQLRDQRRTMTYFEVADRLAVPGPHRIHKTTQLLEILLEQDIERGLPPRSALVLSRNGSGRPAAGFFDRAGQLGLSDGGDSKRFHEALLARLFEQSPS